MSFKTFHRIAAITLALACVGVSRAATFPQSVTTTRNLNQISTDIQGSPNKGTYVIRFSNYADVGQLKLDNPGSNVDSLLLSRDDITADGKYSDGVIDVDSTFMDLKSMSGPVIIRGLAFRLLKPASVLIAGAETNKENRKLVIEDCSIYADNLSGTFISWLADLNSSVEIRRTFIVARDGTPTARINVSAGNVILSNNLFNFPGAVIATVTKGPSSATGLDFSFNNVNRTQFKFIGESYLGVQPSFKFTRSFIAHPPVTDAISTGGLWVMTQLGFDIANADVKDNKLFTGWSGFDYQPGQNNYLWNSNTSRNLTVAASSYPKPATELWHWYTTSVDTSIGMQSGSGKRATPYNVFPSDSLNYRFTLPSADLKVFFKTALFPREIRVDTSEVFPPISDPLVRTVFPAGKALRFGPFSVDSIVYSVPAIFGSPVLAARDVNGAAVVQAPNGGYGANSSVYVNSLPSARAFLLAGYGNTARGDNVTPGAQSGLNTGDYLVFKKVDSAGFTLATVPDRSRFADNLRNLDVHFGIHTSASTLDSVSFGTGLKTVKPYSPDQVYWCLGEGDSLVPAQVDSTGRYIGHAAYASKSGDFAAHLVERLSVPRGDVTSVVDGGSFRTLSANGFQMKVMDDSVIDTLVYGEASKGFRFYPIGRAAGDSIILSLSGKPDQTAWVRTDAGTVKYEKAEYASGKWTMPIGQEDTAKTFFVAYKFNVLANVPTTRNVEGIADDTILNFTSSRSGNLFIHDLDGHFLDSVAQVKADLANRRFLGGRQLLKSKLVPTAPFSIGFTVDAYKAMDSVEAWAWSGGQWEKIPHTITALGQFTGNPVPAAADFILVVERLAAPENYVTITPTYDARTGKLTVTPSAGADTTLKPVTGYCVEVRGFGLVDTATSVDCKKKSIDSSSVFSLAPNSAYQYRIRYFLGNDAITKPFRTLPGSGLSLVDAIPKGLESKAAKHWSLIGFPVNAGFYEVMHKGQPLDTAKFKDTDSLVTFTGDAANTRFTGIPNIGGVTVNPGDAYFFASSRTFTVVVDNLQAEIPVGPYKLPVTAGWNLVTNPYPSHFQVARIRAAHAQSFKNAFQRLTCTAVPSVSDSCVYGWDSDSQALLAFQGYAYYSDSVDTLIFDPFAVPDSSVAGKVAAGSGAAGIRAVLRSASDRSEAGLTARDRSRSIPFLPRPGAGIELRLGGGAGYFRKKVKSLEAIDEPVEIRSLRSGRVSFSLEPSGAEGSGAPMAFRLVDMKSGKVYDEAAASELPVLAGSNAFRLLAGDPRFVAGESKAILAGAPGEFGLSQNFPNPFRGITRVALDWPAWQEGERTAVLEVIDTRGRIVSKSDLKDIRMGRQVVALDAAGWSPGVYTYRLTVSAGSRKAVLRKRMLVLP